MIAWRRSIGQLALTLVLSAGLSGSFAASALSSGVEDFYKGRTISLTIGAGVGGGYDGYGRLVARFMGKYIPGQPNIVPQNMPGAGGFQAAEYIYSVAPKDGTAIAALARGVPLAPLLMNTGVRYDGRKFTWLGSISEDVSICLTSDHSKIRRWEDVLAHDFSLGGSTSDLNNFALLIKNIFNAKMKLVRGYKGTNEIALAMERGEVDGMCGISTSTLRSAFADKLKDKKVFVVVQTALKGDPDWRDVPVLIDLAKSDEQRAILKLILGSQTTARPYAAPAGIPEDRKAALRTAFDRLMTDPEFVAAVEKLSLDISPTKGAEVEAIVNDGYATPADALEKAKAAIAD
jgi:tripartite-type tricarboxylate transporter receptor subunit TctC